MGQLDHYLKQYPLSVLFQVSSYASVSTKIYFGAQVVSASLDPNRASKDSGTRVKYPRNFYLRCMGW